MATTDELLDLDGIAQRQETYRFLVLDAGLVQVGDPLTPVETVTVSNDSTRPTQRTASGLVLGPDQAAVVDEFTARIRIQLVLENGDVRSIGTFRPVNATRTVEDGGLFLAMDLHDFTSYVDRKSVKAYGVQSGGSIPAAIDAILAQQGIVNREILTTTPSVGAPVAWAAGTSWLEIVNRLAALGGCPPLFFDADGTAIIRPTPSLEFDETDVIYRTEATRSNMFATVRSSENDALTAFNAFYVYETGGTGVPIVGEYLVPSSAPHSYYNTGDLNPEVVFEQGLFNDQAAAERARLLSLERGAVERRSFDGPADPRHGNQSIIEYEGERWLEESWSITCAAGADMRHTLVRVYT